VARYSGLGPAGTAPFSPVFLSQPDPSPRAPCSVSSVADRSPRPSLACRCRTVPGPLPIYSLYSNPSLFYSSSSSKHKLLPTSAIATAPRAPVTRRHAPSLLPRSHQKGACTLPPAPPAHHPTQDSWRRSEIKFSPPPLGALRCHHLTGRHRAPSCRQRRRLTHRDPRARAAASHKPANQSSRAAVSPPWKPELSRALSSFAVHAAPWYFTNVAELLLNSPESLSLFETPPCPSQQWCRTAPEPCPCPVKK
jgi:hypothetical protein